MKTDAIDNTNKIEGYELNKERSIILKVVSEQNKFDILRNTKHLSGTNVWIEEDYIKKVQN